MQSCPVVAIDAGGVGELIENNVTGLLARHNDLDDFCEKVRQLLNQPELAAQLGLQGALAARTRHDLPTLAAQTLDVYRRAIADSA